MPPKRAEKEHKSSMATVPFISMKDTSPTQRPAVGPGAGEATSAMPDVGLGDRLSSDAGNGSLHVNSSISKYWHERVVACDLLFKYMLGRNSPNKPRA